MYLTVSELIEAIPTEVIAPGGPITCKKCGHEFKIPSQFKENWIELKYPCLNKKCQETYCNKKTATERDLFRIQDQYVIADTDEKRSKYLGQLHKTMIPFFESILKGSPNISKQLYHLIVTDPSFCNEIAGRAAYFIIKQYLEREDFIITDSFSGYAYKGAFYDALFNRKYRDILGNNKNINKNDIVTEVVSIDLMYDDSGGGESERAVHQVYNYDIGIQRIEQEEYSRHLVKQLIALIMEATDKYIDGHKEKLAARIALLNYFKNDGNPHYADKYFRVYGREGKSLYEDVIELISNELKKETSFSKEYKPKKTNDVKEKKPIGIYDLKKNLLYLGDYIRDIKTNKIYTIVEEERKGQRYYGYYINEKFSWINTDEIEKCN